MSAAGSALSIPCGARRDAPATDLRGGHLHELLPQLSRPAHDGFLQAILRQQPRRILSPDALHPPLRRAEPLHVGSARTQHDAPGQHRTRRDAPAAAHRRRAGRGRPRRVCQRGRADAAEGGSRFDRLPRDAPQIRGGALLRDRSTDGGQHPARSARQPAPKAALV